MNETGHAEGGPVPSSQSDKNGEEAAPGPVREIDVAEAARQRSEGALLLDVREDDEWTAGHAEGATHLRLGDLDLDLDLDRIPTDRPIVAICRSGNRSGKAAVTLQAAGRDVVNMSGGMAAWTDAGFPLVTDDGRAGVLK